ncbi:MAG: FAD-dependent oxidoreductase [Oscillospiraceae bacterium]|nr:FAD-dependent oxidoreductase [Oscillospiraceae bacterium]
MKSYDAAVIGGGVLGCFALRSLCRYRLSAVLIEAQADVCMGITRANSAIVYAGYDNKPGSLKARMCVRANRRFHELCSELDVPFSRCGSLMTGCGEKAKAVLEKKYRDGIANGLEGLALISGDKARKMEPMLSRDVKMALYAPMTGTVNPWRLGIAACENAVHNGAELRLNTKLLTIEKTEGGYVLRTSTGDIFCKAVINCAGLSADMVQRMAFPCAVSIETDAADFIVMDKDIDNPAHIIFQEKENGKGITAVPCTEGNLLIDSAPRAMPRPFATDAAGIDSIKKQLTALLPELEQDIIRAFAAVRPNPHSEDGRSINDFCIETPAPGFVSLIGIKTPGLTCAEELGRYAAKICADYLNTEENPHFDGRRKAINCADDDIVCLCQGISRAEIIESIRRGARTVEAVKRRVGTGMGRCQGSRCEVRIAQILERYRNGTL